MLVIRRAYILGGLMLGGGLYSKFYGMYIALICNVILFVAYIRRKGKNVFLFSFIFPNNVYNS